MSEASASHERARGPTVAANDAIELEVNGEPLRVAAPCTVLDLLKAVGLAGKRVAIAVDRNVVVRSRYAEFELGPGNRVEILEAVGGG